MSPFLWSNIMSTKTIKKSIDWHAKSFFITYPRCGLTKEDIKETLYRKFPTLSYYTIGREDHDPEINDEFEGKHLHVVITFLAKKRIRDCRAFDITIINDQGESKTFHPNVQSPRKLKDCINYCKKNDDYISNHDEQKKGYSEIITQSHDFDSFMNSVEENYPRDMVLHFDKIKSYANYKFADDNFHYELPAGVEFEIPNVLKSWLDNEVRARSHELFFFYYCFTYHIN